MVSRWIRTWYSAVLQPFLDFIARLGVGPNAVTIGSLIVVTIAGLLIAFDKTFWGAWILLLGGFLDGIDGALAALTGVKSPFGAFLDSICDHCGDFVVYLGMLWLSLQEGQVVEVILIFVALFASVFGSHVRSRAGMVGIDLKTIGLFTRAERILVIVFGLLTGKTTLALWVLATFNGFSMLQRVIYMVRASLSHEKNFQAQETT